MLPTVRTTISLIRDILFIVCIVLFVISGVKAVMLLSTLGDLVPQELLSFAGLAGGKSGGEYQIEGESWQNGYGSGQGNDFYSNAGGQNSEEAYLLIYCMSLSRMCLMRSIRRRY